MSKKKDLSLLSISDLNSQIDLCKKSQLNLRFQRAIGEIIKSNLIRNSRKDIARMKTELNKRGK